jgi:hypothetical protein
VVVLARAVAWGLGRWRDGRRSVDATPPLLPEPVVPALPSRATFVE